MRAQGVAGLRAPSLDDIDALAESAYAQLPASFRRLCQGLVIQVVDFPDDETLDEMDAQSEFDLLGLFRGRGLAHRGAVEETGELPNMIWLYRRPLLDYWCEGEDTLASRRHPCARARDRPPFRPFGCGHGGDRTLGPLKRFGLFAAP